MNTIHPQVADINPLPTNRPRARFSHDERGAVFVLTALLLPALIGMGLLAVDLSRVLTLQTQLQKAADSFAIAAAAELDLRQGVAGQGSAISRANSAIANLMANRNASWSNLTIAPVTATARYLSRLPANDATPIPSSDVTTDSSTARFVEVTVTPTSVTAIFPAVLFGQATNSFTTTATAVAGNSQVICGVTPIAICNGNTSNTDLTNEQFLKGKQIVAPISTGQPTTPLTFNYIDVLNCGNSAGCVNTAIGATVVNGCVRVDNAPIVPGVKDEALNYFNSRFGLFAGNAKTADQNIFTPALNNRKGYLATGPGSVCARQEADLTATPGARALPNDSNIVTLDTPAVGNGVWSINPYWCTNFPSLCSSLPTAATRYDLYYHEYDSNLLDTQSTGINCPGPNCVAETGRNICAPGITTGCDPRLKPGDTGFIANCPDRRIMHAIVRDCSASNPLAAIAVVELFLLRPFEFNGSTRSLVVEYKSVSLPGDGNGVLKDLVQLYR